MRYKFLSTDGKFIGFSDYKTEGITIIRDTQTDLDWDEYNH